MSKITVFPNISETKHPYYISIEHAFDRIKHGKSKDKVIAIRKLKSKSERDKLKMSLPSVCFSGIFKERKKESIITHSGFICLDFDNIDNIDLIKEKLKSNPYIYACWLSPSGNGLKAIVRIPPKKEKHEQYFDALKEEFENIDTSGRDFSRVCYESYDPDIYINATSKVYDTIIEQDVYDYDRKKPDLPLTDETEVIKRIERWMENKGEHFSSGNRNSYILKVAGAFNRFGISEYLALSYLKQYTEKDFTEAEINKTIKSAYKNKADHGKSYFENIDSRNEIRRELREGRNIHQIAGNVKDKHEITDNDALRIIEKERLKINNRLETFWYVETNNKGIVTKIELNRKKFIDFLQENGFFKHKITTEYYVYVHITENIIDETSIAEIKKYVFNWVDKLENEPFDNIDKYILYEFLAKGVKTFFSKDLLDLLDNIELNINNDTADTSYFYYINGAVKIRSDNIELVNYYDLPGRVWKRQIIDRHIVLMPEHGNNNYSNFLEKIIDKNEVLSSLLSAIGFLLHGYKDKKISKAIVFNDRQVTDNPEGGSGKGLIVEGIRQIKSIVVIDGKVFSPDKSFAMQRVELDTEIIFLDDVRKNFDFERLFSIITEGITVEKKNKAEFFIPYNKSPKLAIATNYYLRGEGQSNDRRKLDIEINNYFNANHTPFDEFNETLFSDWTNEIWNDFDNTMINICQYYLKTGLIESNSDSIKAKKLVTNTSPEFIEFADSIPKNTEVNRKELLNDFIELYPNYKRLSSRRLLNWISTYCNHYNYQFERNYRRSGNNFFILINDGTTTIPDPNQSESDLFDQEF